MSSNSDEWATPTKWFEDFAKEWGPFDLDPCATAENAKAPRFYTEYVDGLKLPWVADQVFCNPPYSEIAKWVAKAQDEVNLGHCKRVCMLVPARTDTRWFSSAFARASLLLLIKGRLKFGGHKTSAPFPSCVFVFGARIWGPPEVYFL